MLVLGMPGGRPKKPFSITRDERVKLEDWARRPKTSQRLALRSKIVLLCAEGISNTAVAQKLRTSNQNVCKWRERFRISHLEGLADEPRPVRATPDWRCRCGRGDYAHLGRCPCRRNALVHTIAGSGSRDVPVC